MEPRNLANILSSDDHIDTDIPSEEEQLRWALNASKVMMEDDKPVEIDDDEDDPELTRVLEESRLLFEQQNNNNGVTRHTPSPSGSPSLLCDGNVTTDSGYFSNNVDHSSEDPLQHKVSGAVINGLKIVNNSSVCGCDQGADSKALCLSHYQFYTYLVAEIKNVTNSAMFVVLVPNF